jgi:hypothetical protein
MQVLIHLNNIHSELVRYALSVNVAVAFSLPPFKFEALYDVNLVSCDTVCHT